jgi:hypothetical protein
VSRTIDRLAADPIPALRAIHTARAAARARAWQLAGAHAPDHAVTAGAPLVIAMAWTPLPPLMRSEPTSKGLRGCAN